MTIPEGKYKWLASLFFHLLKVMLVLKFVVVFSEPSCFDCFLLLPVLVGVTQIPCEGEGIFSLFRGL